MSKTKHEIEVELKGTILQYFFCLEGECNIPLYSDFKGTLRGFFEEFEVEDELNIYLTCRGAYAGTKCILSIKVDGKGPKVYTRTFSNKKMAAVIDDLKLPLKQKDK